MAQFVFAVYEPPKKGMPFLAVCIEGVKTPLKKVKAVATKTRADAEKIVDELERDLRDPHWRDRVKLHEAYGKYDPDRNR